ncbi:MAG: hypothetical protein U1F26_05045 [Lysobacterales bacterium]
MNRWIPAIAVLMLGALMIWFGRDLRTASADTDSAVLRAYRVPVERAESLEHALSMSLNQVGNVTRPAPDQLLVLATPKVQASVAQTLTELAGASLTAGPDPGPVTVHFWVVDASDDPEDDAGLAAIADTLKEIRTHTAAAGFDLRTHLALTTTVGGLEMSRVADEHAQVDLRLSPGSEGVNIDLSMEAGMMNLRSQTRLALGQTIVLAQAAPKEGDAARVRLVIVRAEAAGS